MINKKVCMVGALAVGKTSLIEQYVRSIFSDHYLSTLGVKVSKKECRAGEQIIHLVLWDMEGGVEYNEVSASYLRGAMGFFIVADGTRRDTLATALPIRRRIFDIIGHVPHYLLLNKADLLPAWQVTEDDITQFERQDLHVMKTSAKTGEGVESAFTRLTEAMVL